MIPGGAHALMLGGDPCEVYQIGHSVRFNAADTPYLARAFVAPTDVTKWTFSAWIKRSGLGTQQVVFSADDSNYVEFWTDNTLRIVVAGVAYATTRVFRDPGAHFHVCVRYDAADETNKFRVEVDGVEALGFNAAQTVFNSAITHRLSARAAGNHLDGYCSDLRFVDGQVLSAASFGFTCPSTGQWRPRHYSGTYGTNGFHLDFSDGSAATAAALGADRSGNGNNWMPTNLSVTAGVGCDWMEDTPTNNFCTLNPLDLSMVAPADGALKWDGGGVAGTRMIRSTFTLPSSGKWYWEATWYAGAPSTYYCHIGVMPPVPITDTTSWLSYFYNGNKCTSGASGSAYGSAFTVGDTIGIAFDADAGTLTFYKNGVSQGVAFSGIAGGYSPFVGAYGTTGYVNFGQRPFAYAPPTGFKTLCTKNLPRPRITKPSNVFIAATGSGANIQATLAATRSGWAAYIEIIKRRDAAEGWHWRFSGDVANYLDSSSTAAKAAFPALGGAAYVGYTIKVSADAGIATGVLNHINGVADVVTDGLANSRKLIILKREDAAGSWYVYHPELTAGKLLYLQQFAAETTDGSISAVTASGFTVAAALPSGTYRWVSLAETGGFLKLGKYTGNGNANGPFIGAGMTPGLMSLKKISGGTFAMSFSDWVVFDTARNSSNLVSNYLLFNNTQAEVDGSPVVVDRKLDSTTGGAKIRAAYEDTNLNGGAFVYLFIAAFPFGYANAR